MIRADGIEVPADDALDDEELHMKLWEIIEKMASLRFFLDSTDHLSDRELYRFLVTDALLVDELLPGARQFCQISPIGGGSQADNEIYLRYYAGERCRARWQRDFGQHVPERETPPFDRDRLLPVPDAGFAQEA